MAEVTVTINGRTYKMSCDDGQEKHLLGLAGQVNSYVEQMKTTVGQVGDTRLLLMASIMIADHLSETKRRVDTLEKELQRQQSARDQSAQRMGEEQVSIASALEETAARIEDMTRRLSER